MGDKVLFIVEDFIFVGESCVLLYFLTLRINEKCYFSKSQLIRKFLAHYFGH